MTIANNHFGRLYLSQIEAQRNNMVGFVVSGHMYVIFFVMFHTDIAAMIGMMRSDKYDVHKGMCLMSELGITLDSPETLDYKTICQLWLKDSQKQHSLDILVCALIRSGLGKLSTCLQPRCML